MRTTVRRGRVILAAATAATLAACGDDTTAGGTEGGSSGGAATSTSAGPTTDTTTDTTTGPVSTTAGGSSTGDATTGAGPTTVDPDISGTAVASSGGGETTSSGGETDGEDSGSTGGAAVSLTPEDVCPFDTSFYSSGEFAPNAATPGQAPLGGPETGEGSSSMFYLLEGTAGDDQIRDPGGASSFPCVVAGDGDDFIEWEFGEGGEGMAFATISGGLGADTFAYRGGLLSNSGGNSGIPVQTIVDFEPGVDRIVLDATLSVGIDADVSTVTVSDDFGGGSVATPGLIIDNLNGDIWYAADNGEVVTTTRIIHLEGEGAGLAVEDVSIIETIPGCDLNQGFANDFRDGGATGEGMMGDNPTSAEGSILNSGGIALGSQGDDFFEVPGQNGPKCVAGGDGDDILRAVNASSAESTANNQTAVLAGGAGSDTFVVSLDAVTGEVGAVSPLVIGDFEPAVDTMVLNPQNLGVGETGEATVTFIDDFGTDSAAPVGGRSLVIDAADGDVWLSAEASGNSLLVVLEGAPAITASDVDVISPADG